MTDLQATLRDRFGAAVSPPLLDLHGRPRRTHTPEAVQAVCEIADSVLATGDAEIQRLRSYVDRYRIGLVGMSRRATRFRIAWRNARQRAARYRARLAAAEARVTELEQALADADATQLHTDGACEAVQRAETAEAAIDGALPDLRRAIDSMPTTCRYHGDRLDPDQYGRMVRSEACCDTGVAPRRAREARRAIDRLAALDEPTQQPTDTTQEQP